MKNILIAKTNVCTIRIYIDCFNTLSCDIKALHKNENEYLVDMWYKKIYCILSDIFNEVIFEQIDDITIRIIRDMFIDKTRNINIDVS